jgi:hypothetical protein
MAEVVNGEHGSGRSELALLFAGVETDRNHRRRPVVDVHHVGKPIERAAELKCRSAEERETSQIVRKSRFVPGPINAVTSVQDLVIEKKDWNLGVEETALIHSAPLLPISERHSERFADTMETPDVDGVIAREDDAHIVSLAAELRRKRGHHVAEPAGLCERDDLARDHEDFEASFCQRNLPTQCHGS